MRLAFCTHEVKIVPEDHTANRYKLHHLPENEVILNSMAGTTVLDTDFVYENAHCTGNSENLFLNSTYSSHGV